MKTDKYNKWFSGIPYELAFWSSIYRGKKPRYWLIKLSELNKEISLHNFDVKKFLESMMTVNDSPIVLDVGCGMSYYVGNKLKDKDLDIRYVDPLAPFYNRILDRYNVDTPRIEFGMMEYMSSFYPKGNVSLIIIQNALDHSANPIKGILECLNTLRIGGVLYLKHYPNEAEKEQYKGFHQYNVDIRDNQLFIWNHTVENNINNILFQFADVEVSRYINPNEIIAVITKKKDVITELLDKSDDVYSLCNVVMEQAMQMDCLPYMLKYHIKKPFYNVVQFFMRYVSIDTKNKIKKILRGVWKI